MDISATAAARSYAQAQSAAAPSPAMSAASDFLATLREGEAAATAGLAGQGDVTTVATALARTQLAVETAVAVRDRVVEAYQELLRMPV